MQSTKRMMALGLLIVGMAGARAQIIPIGTGLDASGDLLPDGQQEINYTVSGVDSKAITYYLNGSWLPGDWLGQWIAPVDSSGKIAYPQETTLRYTRKINGTGTMTGWFSADNNGQLLVNGVQVAATPNWGDRSDTSDFLVATPFAVHLGQAVNTIEFDAYNASGPDGLLVSGLFTPDGEPCPSATLSGGAYANGTFSCNVTGTPYSTWQICALTDGTSRYGATRNLGVIVLDKNGNGTLSDSAAGYYNNYDSFDGAGNGAYWLSNSACGTVTRQYGYWQTMVPAGMESYAVANGSGFYSPDNTLNANLPAAAFTYPYNYQQDFYPSMTGDLVPVTDLDDYVDGFGIFLDVVEDNYDHNIDSSGTSWYVPDGAVDPSNPPYSGDQISFGPGETVWLYQYLNNDVVISLFGYWN